MKTETPNSFGQLNAAAGGNLAGCRSGARANRPTRFGPQDVSAPSTPVLIYTDGCCLPNPGRGGYAAVLMFGPNRKEISAGFRRTTNNRMELWAVIAALEQLQRRRQVVMYTDSQYVCTIARKVHRPGRKFKKNPDLCAKLAALCAAHDVEFRWVRGHAGHPLNSRCDTLAEAAALGEPLLVDTEYEEGSPPGGINAYAGGTPPGESACTQPEFDTKNSGWDDASGML